MRMQSHKPILQHEIMTISRLKIQNQKGKNKMTHTQENIITALKPLLKEQTGYPVVHTGSDSHAHYFSTKLFDINEEVKVVVDDADNIGKWEVFTRYEGMEGWFASEEFINSETLKFV